MNDRINLKITNNDSFREKSQTWRFIDSLVKDMQEVESHIKDNQLSTSVKKFIESLQSIQKELVDYMSAELIMNYTQQFLRKQKT